MKRFYAILLRLFPRSYFEEYAEELKTVFNLLFDDATNSGRIEVLRVGWRELSGLPKAILHEHLRERRKTTMKTSTSFDFDPGSRKETLAALAPFLFFGALPVVISFIGNSMDIPLWIQIIFVLLFWFSGISLVVLGLKNGAPRWFMPYLGLPLPIACLVIFNTLIDPDWRGFPSLLTAPWLVRQFVNMGLLLGILFILIILLVLVSALFKRLHPFYQKLREDWTLLSFIIYGTVPFVLVISFDDYQNEEPYMFISLLVLALGGRFYLKSKLPWQRFWSLFAGLTISMFTAAAGKGILYAGPWPRPKYFTWQSEMASILVMWIWLALIMLVPLALKILPRSKSELFPVN